MPTANVNTEIEAVVTFATEKSDYGVNGSPVWDEILHDTFSLDSLHMFGREWTEKELRVVFGDMGTDALLGLVFDEIEEWDND